MTMFRALRVRANDALIFSALATALAFPVYVQAQVPPTGPPNVLDLVGGNSASNELLWLNFDGNDVVELNDDANTRSSVRSFDFFKNVCEDRVDVVAADSNRGDLLLYATGRGTAEVNICATGPCPGRPDGISMSTLRRMSAADTGQGGGTPSLWFWDPLDCSVYTAPASPFGTPATSGQVTLDQPGPDPAVVSVLDTEFVGVLGGGLGAGDVLALVSGPTSLVRYRKEDIDALLEFGTPLPSAQVLLGPSFFGVENPAALAFIPGTGGIGSAQDGTSQSEELLITLPNGRLAKVRFETDGQSIFVAGDGDTSTVESFIFLDQFLGNGPLGIDAGVRENETLFVIADRQQGSFLRFFLDVDEDGNSALRTDPLTGDIVIDVLQSSVQFPQGAAVNSESTEARLCVDDNPGTVDTETGCRLFNSLDVHYSQLLDDITGVLETDVVLADIEFIVDNGRNSAGELVLDDGFVIPESCAGLPLPDDPNARVIIYITVNKSFAVPRGDFVLLQELGTKIIPQLGDCNVVGTRLYYHPGPAGTLEDITFYCGNPSRGLGPANSPVAICADYFFQQIQASGGKVKGRLANDLRDEIHARADALQAVVDGLPEPEFTEIKAELTGHIDAARDDNKKRKFDLASLDFDAGVLAVYDNKGLEDAGALGTLTSVNLPTTTYADLLSRFLNLAFFSLETAAQGDYLPPEPLCADEELVDVICRSFP